MSATLYARVASDLLEKEVTIQSQREAPRSHAADDGHKVTKVISNDQQVG